MNEIKMQNVRIGVDSEALNIEAAWGGNFKRKRGRNGSMTQKSHNSHQDNGILCKLYSGVLEAFF